ncbi:MAG: NEW3 domain-containing protein, partial [Pseudomonadota bacterium]
EFKPEKVANLKPGEIKQIEVKITPAQDALVGDYSVAINAQGEKAQENLELRITVKASSAWGWVGVAIIVLVIIGLAFAFRRLGRR